MRHLATIVLWIALSLAAGAVGGAASQGSPEFYARLEKPSWAPSPAVFGPVWSALYLMMGIAAGLVAIRRGRPTPVAGARRLGLRLFAAQLGLNALWTWLFFAWQRGALAFADIVVLALLIAWTIREFARVDKVAAGLLVPYFAWVCFAGALTYAVWRANPQLL